MLVRNIVAIALLATATDPPKPPSQPAAPILTDAQRASFFKAQAEYFAAQQQAAQAQQALQTKQSAMQDAIKKVEAACGEKFQPFIGTDGELVCQAKDAKKEAQK